MFDFQSKIRKCAKKKNMTWNKGKIQLTETDADVTQMLELADKDNKTIITTPYALKAKARIESVK